MLTEFLSSLGSLLTRGRGARMRRFVLGHLGKTQIEAPTRSVILVGGTDDASRICESLDLARQAIAQGCTVIFFDSMLGSDSAGHLCSYAQLAKRESGFYVRGAFDASEVRIADILARGDILYWGPSENADSPQVFASDLGPALDELSAALMQRVGRPQKNHVVIIMVDVVEAFGGFPEKIRNLPSSLSSLDASLVCCEYDDALAISELSDSLEFHIKVQVTPPVGSARKPGVSRRENLREGQAFIKASTKAHDIGPVELSYLRADPIPACPPVAVNMNAGAVCEQSYS